VLPLGLAGDADHVRRFVQEARKASALNRPNIVTICDTGQVALDGGAQIYFVAMELVEGSTPRALLDRGPLDLPRALDVATQLAKAHAAGIVRRDLKPENVMVTSEGDGSPMPASGRAPPGKPRSARRTAGRRSRRSYCRPTALPVVRWTGNGKGLLFVTERGGASNVWLQPLAGGAPRPVTVFDDGHIFAFDVFRDGTNAIVCVRGVLARDVVPVQGFH
jgi:serine/threonine protein kinase